jgi:hypothetical protein
MLNPFKFIDITVFLISLALGIFAVYITVPIERTIYVYPTPDNVDKVQYKDKSDSCFAYEQEDIKCPKNSDSVKVIPVQN